jgi:hypothetical protein
VATFIERAIGAAKLDPAIYEEVEHDPGAMGQAVAIVLIASVAAGIGASGHDGSSGLLAGALASLVGWVVWATVTWLVGTRLLPGTTTEADLGQLLRTIGFSATPGALAALGFLPVVGGLIALAAAVWQLAAMVVAVRQALDYQSTGRAIAVCAIGFLAYLLVAVLLVGGFFAVAR